MNYCSYSSLSDTSDDEEDKGSAENAFDVYRKKSKLSASPAPRRTRQNSVVPEETQKSSQKSSQKRSARRLDVFDGLTKEIESELQKRYSIDSASVSAEELEDKEEEDKLIVVVQNEKGEQVKINTTAEKPFQFVFEKYRQYLLEKGVITTETELAFLLDDDQLQPTETPNERDCETEDIIDVIIKRT